MDKQDVREGTWDALEESGEARFPFPPHGRIPNFAGVDTAADRLAETAAWQQATTVKANPDAPQLPVRRRALRAGKTVYMAVPRLREEKCFLRLDPAEIDDIDHATTVGGSAEVGVPVSPGDLPDVDLIVAGSVAVTEAGVRIGKGEGYSDLEFAILREFEKVDDTTTVATTVHELQVVDEAPEPDPHDVALDLVVTPDRTLETGATGKPNGIDWSSLSSEKIQEIPVLSTLEP